MAEELTRETIAPPGARSRNRSRLALWFIRGVSGFLAVTAALKLFSVVAELPLLRSSAPVLSFLTVPQSTFAAAILEIGIACWLFRRQRSRAAPCIVLWLAAAHTTFGLGR